MSTQPAVIEDELYREIILDHWRSPRRFGTVAGADIVVQGSNPLCGDEVVLTMRLDDATLADIAFSGHGCSISRASASLMCEAVAGRSLEEVRDLARRVRAMMVDGVVDEELGDIEALQGVRQVPVRVKCAMLAWNALVEGLERGGGTVTTEEGPEA